jgi:hypothetical protein
LNATILFAAQRWEGTWKSNPTKTKQSQVAELTCEQQPDGYQFTFTSGVQRPTSAILDGKERPLPNPTGLADVQSWRRIDERSLEQVLKKNGKVTSTQHRVVSADG